MKSFGAQILVSMLSMTQSLPSPNTRCDFGFLLPDRIEECFEAVEADTTIKGDKTEDLVVVRDALKDIYVDYKVEECVGSQKLVDVDDEQIGEVINDHDSRVVVKKEATERIQVENLTLFENLTFFFLI